MRIYFYCHPQGDKRTPAFQHQLINLAFGLRDLGITYFSNINYWKIGKDEFLFKSSDIPVEDCEVVVTSHAEFEYSWEIPKKFQRKNRKYLSVYIDTADGLFTRSHTEDLNVFDIVLKQKSRDMWYPENCKYPWTFGLSPYMQLKNEPERPLKSRRSEILANYRHVHTFRSMGEEFILKLDNLKLNKNTQALNYSEKSNQIEEEENFFQLGHLQSGGRFHRDYLKTLREVYACACFGGNLIPPEVFLKNIKTLRLGNYVYDNTNKGRLVEFLRKNKLLIKHRYTIFQWDSWRLWESFAASTVVVNIDFEKYGAIFPVMPENFKHYIGVDFGSPNESLERINSFSIDDLSKIAVEGAQWAADNYSPKAVAERFLKIVKNEI